MKVTVITVCRNSEKTLERALQSVVDQDYPNIEHIVIDGASSDGTKNILKKFQPHITYLLSEPDSGIYDAMNKGLYVATGDVVCFLNADDLYSSPKVISMIVGQMRRHNVDALIGNVSYFNGRDPSKKVRLYRSDRFTPKRLALGLMPAHPGLFLRKNVIERVGFFDETYKIAGDFEFILRVFNNQDISCLYEKKVLVYMQLGGVSNKSWKSKLKINSEILRACRENGLDTNIWKLLLRYPFKVIEYINK